MRRTSLYSQYRKVQHCHMKTGRLLPSPFSFIGLWQKWMQNSFLLFSWLFVASSSYFYLLSFWVGIYFNSSVKLVEMKQDFRADTSDDRRRNRISIAAVSYCSSSACGAKVLVSKMPWLTWNLMEIKKNQPCE